MRRSPAAALWYAFAILVVVGGPAAVVFVLGTPELALPSEWADARARIDDGTLPAGAVVDIVSVVLVLAWGAGLWFLLAGVLKRDESTQDESTYDESAHDESTHDQTDIPITNDGSEPDEPWYRQGPPIFDEPFSDEYPRVVVPPDEMTPDDGPQDSVWQPATMTADAGDPLGMLSPDATAEDMVSDAEIIGDIQRLEPRRASHDRSGAGLLLHPGRRHAAQHLGAVPAHAEALAGAPGSQRGQPRSGRRGARHAAADRHRAGAAGRPPALGQARPRLPVDARREVPVHRLGPGADARGGCPVLEGTDQRHPARGRGAARRTGVSGRTHTHRAAAARDRPRTRTHTHRAARAQRLLVTSPACARDGALAGTSQLPATAPSHPTRIRTTRTPNPRTSPTRIRIPHTPNPRTSPTRIRIPRTPNPRTSPTRIRIPHTPNPRTTPTRIRIPRTPNPRTTPTRIRIPRTPNPRTSPRASRLPTTAPSPTGIRIPRTPNPRTTPTRIRIPRTPNPRTSPRASRLPTTAPSPTGIRIPRTPNPRTTPTGIRTTPRAANPGSPRPRPHRA